MQKGEWNCISSSPPPTHTISTPSAFFFFFLSSNHSLALWKLKLLAYCILLIRRKCSHAIVQSGEPLVCYANSLLSCNPILSNLSTLQWGEGRVKKNPVSVGHLTFPNLSLLLVKLNYFQYAEEQIAYSLEIPSSSISLLCKDGGIVKERTLPIGIACFCLDVHEYSIPFHSNNKGRILKKT